MACVLKFTALGTYIQSVGINKRASRISGFNSAKIILMCYTICGLCAGIAGLVETSRIYSADTNNIGLNLEMDAILAVALGGNSLGGGKFNLAGSIIGAYTIQAITTTMYALGISSDMLLCDVVDAGYNVKASILADEIDKIAPEDRTKIFDVIEVMIRHSKKVK